MRATWCSSLYVTMDACLSTCGCSHASWRFGSLSSWVTRLCPLLESILFSGRVTFCDYLVKRCLSGAARFEGQSSWGRQDVCTKCGKRKCHILHFLYKYIVYKRLGLAVQWAGIALSNKRKLISCLTGEVYLLRKCCRLSTICPTQRGPAHCHRSPGQTSQSNTAPLND